MEADQNFQKLTHLLHPELSKDVKIRLLRKQEISTNLGNAWRYRQIHGRLLGTKGLKIQWTIIKTEL